MDEAEEVFLPDPEGVVSIYENQELMLQQLGDDVRELGDEAILDLSSAKPSNGVEQLRSASTSSSSSSSSNYTTFWQSDDMIPHTLTFNFSSRRSLKALAIYLDYQADESYTPRLVEILVGNNSYSLLSLFKVTLNKPQGWVCFDLGKAASLSGNGWILLENSEDVEKEFNDYDDDSDESEDSDEDNEDNNNNKEDKINIKKKEFIFKNIINDEINNKNDNNNNEDDNEEDNNEDNNNKNKKKKSLSFLNNFSLFSSIKPQYIRAHCIQFRILSMHDNGKDTHVRQARIYGKKNHTKLMGGYAYKDFKTVEMSQFCMLR